LIEYKNYNAFDVKLQKIYNNVHIDFHKISCKSYNS